MLPSVFRYRDFSLYFLGVIFSQLGSRATVAANLWQIYQLTNSIFEVGLIGLFQAAALLVLSPLGGAAADRLDRRRLLQATQSLSMLVDFALVGLTFSGTIQPWHVYAATLLVSASNTFDQPARQALIPAMLPRHEYVRGFSLLQPSRELAVLLAPGVAGVLIGAGGPGWVYLFDGITYFTLVIILWTLRVPPLPAPATRPSILASISEGVHFVVHKPILWQLVTLDLTAMIFGAYRVLLPALARDVFQVGPQGYGLLAAAPSAGAIVGSLLVFRLAKVNATGQLVLFSTIAYGLSAIGVAHSSGFGVALVAAGALGAFNALGTTVRHVVVQLETPDQMRGRATSLYSMASGGGPAIGDTVMGSFAAALGPTLALSLGALVPIGYSVFLMVQGRTVRSYSSMASTAEGH